VEALEFVVDMPVLPGNISAVSAYAKVKAQKALDKLEA
jgi:hypothetical protein